MDCHENITRYLYKIWNSTNSRTQKPFRNARNSWSGDQSFSSQGGRGGGQPLSRDVKNTGIRYSTILAPGTVQFIRLLYDDNLRFTNHRFFKTFFSMLLSSGRKTFPSRFHFGTSTVVSIPRVRLRLAMRHQITVRLPKKEI